jgi:hypothetical protein
MDLLDRAEPMLQQVLAMKGHDVRPEHPSFLLAVGLLGFIYLQRHDFANAEAMLLQAARGFDAAFGLEHSSTRNCAQNLGNLFQRTGQFDKAERLF